MCDGGSLERAAIGPEGAGTIEMKECASTGGPDSPLLFLSHAGAGSDAARAPIECIASTFNARARGLKG